ncbi:MAG: bifunctional DNA-formamidopyrimidine glycosylase/DNA-(apurinic or apyrimidinic site) lyase [Thermomicrobiales bacterium]
MPELPEVETIRRIFQRELVGRTLEDLAISLPKLTRDSPIPDLRILVGHRILAADRRAKVLILHWSEELSLLIHFKLAGQLAVVRPDGRRLVAGHPVPDPEGTYPHKSTHITLLFDDNSLAYYSDIRQFGWWRLMTTAMVDSALTAFRFGPEGVNGDLDRAALEQKLAKRSIAVKRVLLDQTAVAGLGNIYVDESLHRARIHPERVASSLTEDEVSRLFASIGWALERGIEQGGATIRHQRAYPRDGFPAVHAREGESCPTCGGAIVKTVVGGRGTYFCPACQRPSD